MAMTPREQLANFRSWEDATWRPGFPAIGVVRIQGKSGEIEHHAKA